MPVGPAHLLEAADESERLIVSLERGEPLRECDNAENRLRDSQLHEGCARGAAMCDGSGDPLGEPR